MVFRTSGFISSILFTSLSSYWSRYFYLSSLSLTSLPILLVCFDVTILKSCSFWCYPNWLSIPLSLRLVMILSSKVLDIESAWVKTVFFKSLEVLNLSILLSWASENLLEWASYYRWPNFSTFISDCHLISCWSLLFWTLINLCIFYSCNIFWVVLWRSTCIY